MSLWDKIKKTAEEAAASVKSEIGKAETNIGQTVNNLENKVQKTGQEAIDSTKSELGKAAVNIGQTVNKFEGKVKVAGQKVISKLDHGKAVHFANEALLLPARAAFISMLDLNLLGITSAFGGMKDVGGQHWEEILDKWWIMGGGRDKFIGYIEKNRNKKPFAENLIPVIAKKIGVKIGFNGEWSNATGPTSTQKAANAMVASAAILSASTGTLALIPATQPAVPYVGAGAGVLATFGGTIKKFAKDNGATPQELANIPDKDITQDQQFTYDSNGNLLGADGKQIIGINGKPVNISAMDTILGMPSTVAYGVFAGTTLLLILGGLWAFGVFKSKK